LAQTPQLKDHCFFFSGGIGVEGLYQYQGPISSVDGLNYFVGGGAMLGFGTGRNSQTTFALRLTGGLDYKVANAPIDVSMRQKYLIM